MEFWLLTPLLFASGYLLRNPDRLVQSVCALQLVADFFCRQAEPTGPPTHPRIGRADHRRHEAFPFDEAPAKLMMDHDNIFLPVIKNTLPAMGIGVVRTTVKCPWQNGTIERFNRTLKEELLAHIIPIGDSHLNRLLGEFKTFYNSARPHQANKGLTPDQAEASNDEAFVPIPFDPESLRVEAIPWLAGLHHSYRRVA